MFHNILVRVHGNENTNCDIFRHLCDCVHGQKLYQWHQGCCAAMGLTKPVLYIVFVTLHLLFQMAACLLNGTTRILPVSNSADIVPITRVTVADATSLHKQQLKDLATKANSTGVKPPLKFPPKTRSKWLASLASSRKTEHEYGNVPNQSLVVGLVFGVLSIVGIIIGILVIKFRIHKVSPVAAARPDSSKGEE